MRMTETLLVNMLVFAIILWTYVTMVFILAVAKRDNSIMDISYGPAFFVSAVGTLIFTGGTSPTPYLIAGLMGLWAARLSVRIFKKNLGKPEDARYATWRTEWMKRGYPYFLLRSYLQINLLQGAIILLVALPFMIANGTAEVVGLGWHILGLIVFCFGLGYESLADVQLDKFLAGKRAGTEKADIMQTGLFRFSRRPNYFGETLIWWGFALMVITLPWGWLALVSPLMITYIVTNITGPMLERIFLEKYPEAYGTYMKTTSYFFPWPPKRTPKSLL
jgi:steroid 5-alpha reductase family enzyme